MNVPFHDLRRGVQKHLPDLENAALRVVRSGRFILGERLGEFESRFATYCGVRDCIGMGNGTDAIELALRAVGVEAGDSVACVANAGFYAPTGILAIGARPRFIDIDANTLLLGLEETASALAARPKALVVTHLYGRLAPVEAILPIAARLGVPVIEDCAQGHGASRGSKLAGAFGTIGCFSFYPTKNLGALGDGGACVTSETHMAERLRTLRQYGWTEKYHIETAGARNSRLDEIQAALLNTLLGSLDAANARRRQIAARYTASIRHPDVTLPKPAGHDDVVHLFVVRSTLRNALIDHLRSNGIGCDVHYPLPDHRQPAYGHLFEDVSLPETERACKEILSLPCFPEMSDEEIDRVATVVNEFEG